jgi:hypothetical protein
VDPGARAFALTPGLESATAACQLARSADARELASIAAFAQPVEVCAELVARREASADEFLACLAQELVLRVEGTLRWP